MQRPHDEIFLSKYLLQTDIYILIPGLNELRITYGNIPNKSAVSSAELIKGNCTLMALILLK